MKEFLTFDEIRNHVYPEDIRSQMGIDHEQSMKLVVQLENQLGSALGHIAQMISHRFYGDKRIQQTQSFYKSLLQLADEWLTYEFFRLSAVAVNLAAYVVSDGGDSAHGLRIFEEFEDQTNMALLQMKDTQSQDTPGQLSPWSETFINSAGTLFEAAARIPFDKDARPFHQRAINHLVATAEYDFSAYQNVLVEFYSVVVDPGSYPGAMNIIAQSYEKIMSMTKEQAIRLREQKKPTELGVLASGALHLAAAFIVHFDHAPALREKAAFAFQEQWSTLREVYPRISPQTLKEISETYTKSATGQQAFAGGCLALSNLVDTLIRESTRTLAQHSTQLTKPRVKLSPDMAQARARAKALREFKTIHYNDLDLLN